MMGARSGFPLLAVAAVVALALALFGTPQTSHAQPVLHLPTPEPSPDPNKTLPPLPQFLGGYTAPPKDPLAYDDPGMHFRPPDGWVKLGVNPDAEPSGVSEDLKPVAAFGRANGKNDNRIIVIATKQYDGNLDSFETTTESEARQGGDSTFVSFHHKVNLANGMPAYFLKIDTGSGDIGQSATRYEYLVVDGVRGIVASYSSRLEDHEEDEAKTALASLTVVLYPRGRFR